MGLCYLRDDLQAMICKNDTVLTQIRGTFLDCTEPGLQTGRSQVGALDQQDRDRSVAVVHLKQMGPLLTVCGLEDVGHEVRLVGVMERGNGKLELVRDLVSNDYVNKCLRLNIEVVCAP